ncbi:LOW QUALITY PROTEIN: hypothetical protein HZS_6475 [Henneguya salminicola]|nr:LOW QUALITY PROTEIN: hypothetical protein HZS_6475 [Henneguya salminicola]
MWEYILRYEHFLSPSRIIIDFEKGALRSIQTKFPDVTVSGCYFHFSQNLWREIQSESDMLARYKTDREFTQYVRMLLALSFVPANYLVYVEQTIILKAGWHNSLSKIVNFAYPFLHCGIDEGYHLLAQLNQGQTLRIQKRKYRELQERILRIVQSYNFQNIIQYLKNIAYNLTI